MNEARRGRWMRRAALASVAVGLTLTLAKAAAGILTGSVAILASLADSALDLFASAVTFAGVRTALKPPDREHRFGHGKAEGLAALVQGAAMAGSAVFVGLQAASRLLDPQPVTMPWAGIAVSAAAIVLTLALVAFQNFVVRRTRSLAIRADSLHYKGDLLLNLSVIAGLVASSEFGLLRADALFGIGIAVWIGIQAARVAKSAVDVLMDRELPEQARETIFNIALGNRGVRGLHDLRTRGAGVRDFIQFHIEVDARLSLREAHLIALEVEAAVGEAFPDADILIFVDPLGFERADIGHRELQA